MSRPDVTLYSVGMLYASACAAAYLTGDQVVEAANLLEPTGLTLGWRVDPEDFRTGEPNPCPCDTDPNGRRHWLLSC